MNYFIPDHIELAIEALEQKLDRVYKAQERTEWRLTKTSDPARIAKLKYSLELREGTLEKIEEAIKYFKGALQ